MGAVHVKEKETYKYVSVELGCKRVRGVLRTPKRGLQVRQGTFRLDANGVVRQTRWELPRLRAPLMVNL